MILSNKDKYYSQNNVIADVILALLKQLITRSDIDLQVEVGTFDNCREYGNTYRVLNGEQDYTFCVYEHRNSDEICINGCPTSEVKPFGPYINGSKWDYHFSASYGEYQKVANVLFDMLVDCKKGKFVDIFIGKGE